MAIRPSVRYPGQTDLSDAAGYPYGRAKNQSVAGDGTGTPLEAAWVSDWWGFQQALFALAKLTPSGNPDKVGASDVLNALVHLIDLGDSANAGSIAAILQTLGATRTHQRTIPLRAMEIISYPDTGLAEADSRWTSNRTRDWVEGRNKGNLIVDIGKYLGPGETLTRVEATVTTYARTGNDRMLLSLMTQLFPRLTGEPDGSPLARTQTLGATYAPPEGGSNITITLDPSGGVTASSNIYVELRAAANTPPAGDTLLALRITSTALAL